jgi:hypothetical protein
MTNDASPLEPVYQSIQESKEKVKEAKEKVKEAKEKINSLKINDLKQLPELNEFPEMDEAIKEAENRLNKILQDNTIPKQTTPASSTTPSTTATPEAPASLENKLEFGKYDSLYITTAALMGVANAKLMGAGTEDDNIYFDSMGLMLRKYFGDAQINPKNKFLKALGSINVEEKDNSTNRKIGQKFMKHLKDIKTADWDANATESNNALETMEAYAMSAQKVASTYGLNMDDIIHGKAKEKLKLSGFDAYIAGNLEDLSKTLSAKGKRIDAIDLLKQIKEDRMGKQVYLLMEVKTNEE